MRGMVGRAASLSQMGENKTVAWAEHKHVLCVIFENTRCFSLLPWRLKHSLKKIEFSNSETCSRRSPKSQAWSFAPSCTLEQAEALQHGTTNPSSIHKIVYFHWRISTKYNNGRRRTFAPWVISKDLTYIIVYVQPSIKPIVELDSNPQLWDPETDLWTKDMPQVMSWVCCNSSDIHITRHLAAKL